MRFDPLPVHSRLFWGLHVIAWAIGRGLGMLLNVIDDVRRSRLDTIERVVGNLLGILESLQVDGITSPS